MPALDPAEAIAAVEAQATLLRTPVEGGGSIAWRIWGDGPPLVLLHGGHGSWRHWIRNIPALSRKHRLILPDLPGMGDSTVVGDGGRIEPIADAIVLGIERLRIADRYHLGGFSFGSLAAGYVLARHHARVKGLLLIGSGGLGRFDRVPIQLRRWQEERDPARRLGHHRHNLEVLMLHDPAKIDDLAVAIQAFNAEHTRINHRAAAISSNLGACLEAHPVPTTAIWGAEDVLVRNHLEERRMFLARQRPPGRFVTVPGAGHWVQYEAPDIVNELMLAAVGDAVASAAS